MAKYMTYDKKPSLIRGSTLIGCPSSFIGGVISNMWSTDAMMRKSESVAKYLPGHILWWNTPLNKSLPE